MIDNNTIKYLGIDLGTSNTAMAVATEEGTRILDIEQKVDGHLKASRSSLPSFVYLDKKSDVPSVGLWAKEQASVSPDLTISSAKSCLSHSQVDRLGAILPWGSSHSNKLSPVEASATILRHVQNTLEDEEYNLVLTVPASFDETARKLTVKAAEAGGFGGATLLEEPLAAVYGWISQNPESWREQVKPGDMILVCDVGGGTSDFSLLVAHEQEGQLNLERISVGRHLLLGGDNMDLALAYRSKIELEKQGHQIDEWQLSSLIFQASHAKEQMLTQPELNEYAIGIESRGSNLFAGALTIAIQRQWIDEIVLDGFFPSCDINDHPQQRSAIGLQEFGLAYEHDAAITRHLASFLSQSYGNVMSDERLQKLADGSCDHGAKFLKPSVILFNGGVFNGSQMRQRVHEVVGSWSGALPRVLEGHDCNLAVAKGAAFYSRMKTDPKGLRIRSGTAQSYYLGVESGMMAIPGYTPPRKGLCVIPQGTEEGTHLRLPDKTFALRTGEQIEFKFYGSRTRAGDKMGQEISDADRQLEKNYTLRADIPQKEGSQETYPVWLDAEITELGTMNIVMQHTESDQHWNLEFDVRRHD